MKGWEAPAPSRTARISKVRWKSVTALCTLTRLRRGAAWGAGRVTECHRHSAREGKYLHPSLPSRRYSSHRWRPQTRCVPIGHTATSCTVRAQGSENASLCGARHTEQVKNIQSLISLFYFLSYLRPPDVQSSHQGDKNALLLFKGEGEKRWIERGKERGRKEKSMIPLLWRSSLESLITGDEGRTNAIMRRNEVSSHIISVYYLTRGRPWGVSQHSWLRLGVKSAV